MMQDIKRKVLKFISFQACSDIELQGGIEIIKTATFVTQVS